MAYTVLDSKNINKTKNIYTFGGSGTKPERDDIAENSKLIDYSSGQKFYYDPTKAAGSKWQPDKEPSGGSGGGSLPANFPTESAANANKLIGFDENGNYAVTTDYTPLIVNLTVDTTDPENPVIIGDKTYGEIFSAFSEGRDIRLLAAVDGSDIALTVLAAIRTGDFILLNRTDGNELLVNENGDSNEFFKFTEG